MKNELISILELENNHIKTSLNFSDLVDIAISEKIKTIEEEKNFILENQAKLKTVIIEEEQHQITAHLQSILQDEIKSFKELPEVEVLVDDLIWHKNMVYKDPPIMLKSLRVNARSHDYVKSSYYSEYSVVPKIKIKFNGMVLEATNFSGVSIKVEYPQILLHQIEKHNKMVEDFISKYPEVPNHNKLAREIKVEMNKSLLKQTSSKEFIKKLNKSLGINI